MLKEFMSSEYTVFTLSHCNFCVLVKELLQNENVTYVNCDDIIKFNRQQFIEEMNMLTLQPEHTTFPFVFKNKIFIGGYMETKKKYDNEIDNLNFNDDNF